MSDYYGDLATALTEHGVPTNRAGAKIYLLSLLFGRVLSARETFVCVYHFKYVTVALVSAGG